MDEITKEYKILFNGIAGAISELQATIIRLSILQQQAEQAYIDRTSENEPEATGTGSLPEITGAAN